MFYVVSLQVNAAIEMSKALKHFLKCKQRIRFCNLYVIKQTFTELENM